MEVHSISLSLFEKYRKLIISHVLESNLILGLFLFICLFIINILEIMYIE